MLLKLTRYEDVNERRLMDVYAESYFENTDYFFPEMTDKAAATRKVEEGFLSFLKDEFFARDGSVYWVLSENGIWLSALRTSRVRENLYYLEALETRPDERQKGHAARLLTAVLDEMKRDGAFTLCDSVSKKNVPSLRTHARCGFAIVSDTGYDCLRDEPDEHDFGLMYRYPNNSESSPTTIDAPMP